ncbi:HTH-type transcriptional regulator BhcR [Roseivivax sp. CAU 1761]
METAKNGSGRRARGRPRGWEDKTEQNTIKSLDRAMEVFEHLSDQPGAALSTLAADLDQSPATLYRILVTLEGRGLVEFDAASQLWHVGARAFVIGARFLRRTSLVERARPVLRELMEETGETANLGIAQGASVLFVSQVETQASIRAFFPPGTLSPMHASGIGKALLAHMPAERRARRLAAAPLERFTPHTFCDPAALETELALSRARGWALDGEEKTLGMRCVAAPVFDAHGEAVAGLSVSGPTSRVSETAVTALADRVKAAARQLSQAVGGDPDLAAP